jgi:mannose-6-phosphate isomerase-like protein (cupin superfamily)
MIKSSYSLIQAYVTKDGSEIRELMHPAVHGNLNLSLAEAIVRPGTETRLHRHHHTEEIYHVTAGTGLMTLGDQAFSVTAGDSVCIPPGSAHRIRNTGDCDLRILCCCAPAYSHEDTEIL